ncbi:unknown [Clostridium sp. CAG:149]|nr:unknown [Clostridium sp. CAG:149]
MEEKYIRAMQSLPPAEYPAGRVSRREGILCQKRLSEKKSGEGGIA